MAKVYRLILLIIILYTTCKVQCGIEKISYFLSKHEVTKVTEIDPRRPKFIMDEGHTEKTIQIKAFEKTFTLDLTNYFPKEDSEIEYISKLRNSSDSFLGVGLTLFQGYVRDVKDSYVVGSFFSETHFRGYVLTDEIYCIEPFNESNVFMYRFKDVIVPGCSKFSEDEDLDCSETFYFTPWKANKPPKKEMPSIRYSLLYDRYFEEFNRLQTENNKDKTRKTEANDKTAGETSKEKEPIDSKRKEDKKDSGKQRKKTTNNEKAKNDSKTKQGEHRAKHHKGDDDDDDDDDNDDDIEESKTLYLKEQALYQSPSASFSENNLSDQRKNSKQNLRANDSFLGKEEDSFPMEEEILKNVINSPIMESLEGSVSELQCNLEIVIGPSLIKKFDNRPDDIVKDVYTQMSLLNKIFRKVSLTRKGFPFHLTLLVQSFTIYGDEVYSPFKMYTDLEYFAKTHRPIRQFCLAIGLVNSFLKSGQIFDGYIPEGGGGACAHSGNNIIVSHGNENTPVPMALYFAALVRGVTRALGANDKDRQCDQGTYPNPMLVLQNYLLSKEINPTKEYSIFTSCNIKEIDESIKRKECLVRIIDPLCGNGVLDEGEECDCGPSYYCKRMDPCCNYPHPDPIGKSEQKSKKGRQTEKGCTLVKGAKCSSKQECCAECQIDKRKTICYSGSGTCDIATCDGKSADCPKGVEASNGMLCSQRNETTLEPTLCRDGKCELALCTGHGLKPCTCAAGTGRDCVHCCARDGKCRAAGTELQVIEGREFYLPDGTECMGGYCFSGKCLNPDSGREHQMVNYTIQKKSPPILPSTANGCDALALPFFLKSIATAVLLSLPVMYVR